MKYLLLFTLLLCIEMKSCSASQNSSIQILIPDRPLQPGALQLIPLRELRNFCDWTDEEHLETYHFIQKIDQWWSTNHITDYCIYGRDSIEKTSSCPFRWEIIPCPASGGKENLCLRFITTVIHIAYGAKPVSDPEQERVTEDFYSQLDADKKFIKTIPDQQAGKDIFCHAAKYQNQLIYEGQTINILHDYAPAAEIHLLFVTKKHRERCSDLTDEEYLETMHLAQKVIRFYQGKGFQIANLHVKNGPESGQSQPHWHFQVALSKNRQDELMTALEIIKDACLKGHTPLSRDVLIEKVRSIKEDLKSII